MIIDFLEKLHEKSTVDGVWSLLIDEMATFGFDRLLYAFTRYRSADSYGHREDILILSNHSDDYMKTFIGEGMYFDAPMVEWSSSNIGARSWGIVADRFDDLTKAQQSIITFNRSMGLMAGYSIGFKDISARSKGGIGLVAKPGMSQSALDEMWAVSGREIVQINNIAHLKMSNLPYSTLRRPLTTRQREVLQWVGDGKTTKDIATIMGLTAPTIEKHLKLARESLGVNTTPQAVLKASYQNQIFVLGE